MLQKLFGVAWQVPVALFALSALVTVNAQAQSTGWRVTESKVVGSKVYLDLDLQLLEDQLEILHNGVSGSSSSDWGDVLTNGGNPGMDVNFSGYDALGLEDVTAAGTMTADSLVLNKDASITGRLNVTNVVTLSDSLKVSGFVEFGDSLEVVKAVTIGETLYVTGVTSLGDSLHVVGNVDFDALFNVDGAATFGSTLTVTGFTALNDSLHVGESVEIDGDLLVNGAATLTSAQLAGGTASGSRSFARGYNAVASGSHSLVLDSLAMASGISSKALGRESEAVATDAVAFGYNSDAADPSMWSSAGYGWHAMAFGAGSNADGSHSFALGQNSTVNSSAYHGMALGHGSTVNILTHFGIAFGQNSNAGGGAGSMTFGMGSSTLGAASFSMAFGYNASAGGVSAMAFGYNSTATMFHAMAFGYNSKAMNPSALAFGEGSTASGWNAKSFGPSSTASAANAYSLGQSATASGYNSLAFGPSSTATTGNAIAFGERADAKAWNSYALGYKSETNGSQSFVQAAESNANSVHQVILGSYADATPFASADAVNWVETDPLVVIGNGSSTADRTNAFVMLKDGSAMFSDSLHVGRNLDVTGTLDISGETTLNDSLHVNSGADINATLYADSISTPGLNVTENFTFTDGTQGAGKVLTSDANGNATWSDAPLGFNHYEAWIDHASIVAGVTASTTSAHMYVDSTSTQSYDPNSLFGLSAGQITISTPGYYEIEGYVFGTRSTTGSGFVTASVQLGTTTLPQCTATEEWTFSVNSSVRTNCRVLVNPGQAIQLNIVDQAGGTSNISDAGIVIRKVGTALTPP